MNVERIEYRICLQSDDYIQRAGWGTDGDAAHREAEMFRAAGAKAWIERRRRVRRLGARARPCCC